MSRVEVKRRVEELSKPTARMMKAYLAETYDGIGQYVMVTLTRNGITAALKGRVASGDFGGMRTFPEGTPVIITSYHGKIEVFLGNNPNCGITDGFNRELTDTWGESDSGLLWNTSGPVFTVDGEQGIWTMAPGVIGGSVLLQSWLLDAPFDYLLAGSLSDTANSTSNHLDFYYTLANGFNTAEVQIDAVTGHTNVYRDDTFDSFDLGPTVIPAEPWFLRVHIDASTFQAKFWQATDAEPDDWTGWTGIGMDVVDQFRFGFTANHNNSSGTMIVKLDSLDVTGIDRCTAAARDAT